MNLIQKWTKFARLEISQSKSEAFYIRKPRATWSLGVAKGDKYPRIVIDNQAIKFRKSIRYLGVRYNELLRAEEHVEYLERKVLVLFAQFRKVAAMNWGLKFSALRTIYKGVVIPVITYTSAGWYDLCGVKDRQIIARAQKFALLVVSGAYRLASRESLCVIAGSLPIDLQLKQSRARYQIRSGEDVSIAD